MSAGNANKGEGTWEVRRTITLPALRQAAETRKVVEVVGIIAGVRTVAADEKRVRLVVRYDAAVTGYHLIKTALESAGYPLKEGGWSRLKESWYNFVDANMRENASAPPPACCNKPPRQRKP